MFHAFRLERPTGLVPPTGPKPPAPTPPAPTPPIPTPPTPTPEFIEWSQRLDDWAGGTELTQADANILRNVLRRFLEKAVPWNRLRLGKRSLSSGTSRVLLTIPNARGNDASAATYVPIAEGYKDPEGELRLTLLGALRLDKSRGQGNYPEADEDSARVATLVERLVERLIPHLDQRRHQEVRVLTWILRRQARVLGLVPRARISPFDSGSARRPKSM